MLTIKVIKNKSNMMFLEFIRTSGNQIKKINDKTYLSDTEEPPRLCLENKNKLY